MPSNPADPSQYIRTFAKDVARLTGQPAPASAVARPVPLPSAPGTAQVVEDGVGLPEVDASPVNRPDGIAPEYEPEVLQTSKEDEQGIFAAHGTAAPAPLAPAATAAAVPDVETQRAGILARLRGGAPKNQEGAPSAVPSVPLPAAAPVQPAFEAVPAPYPAIPPISRESAAPAPAPVPVPPAEATPLPLHTYKSDFADRLEQQHASAFSVLAASSDAGQATAAPAPSRSVMPLVFGILFVFAGAGAALGAYYYYAQLTKVPIVSNVPSLVAPDSATELKGAGADLTQALAALAATQPPGNGNLVVAYVSTTTTTQNGIFKAPAPGGVLIAAMDLGAPSILLRNIDPASTVGVLSTSEGSAPFFIFRVTSYDSTFAGMLQWEPTMGDDLKVLYPAYPAQTAAVASTTASTTPVRSAKQPAKQASTTPASLPPAPPQFADEIVSNHQVRALKDSQRRTILLYGYVDKQTLVLVRDETAFTALLGRLAATPST